MILILLLYCTVVLCCMSGGVLILRALEQLCALARVCDSRVTLQCLLGDFPFGSISKRNRRIPSSCTQYLSPFTGRLMLLPLEFSSLASSSAPPLLLSPVPFPPPPTILCRPLETQHNSRTADPSSLKCLYSFLSLWFSSECPALPQWLASRIQKFLLCTFKGEGAGWLSTASMPRLFSMMSGL